MLNSFITTNEFFFKYWQSKLVLRHGYMDSFITSMKKKSNKTLFQVQNNVVSLMLEVLIKSSTPQKFSS